MNVDEDLLIITKTKKYEINLIRITNMIIILKRKVF